MGRVRARRCVRRMSESLELEKYNQLLEGLLAAGYRWETFTRNEPRVELGPFVLLRHDVDFSLEHAVQMAEVEYAYGVTATYFVQLRSPLYNLMSVPACRLIDRIQSRNHVIGLHFDPSFYSEQVADGVRYELDLLLSVFPEASTDVVSLHRPRLWQTWAVEQVARASIVHTYDDRFVRDVAYFSDSAGIWQRGNPMRSDDFRARRSMHILTHPLWWVEGGATSIAKLGGYIRRRRELAVTYLEETAVSFSLAALRG